MIKIYLGLLAVAALLQSAQAETLNTRYFWRVIAAAVVILLIIINI